MFMTIYDALKTDHRKVQSLLAQLVALGKDEVDRAKEVTQQIKEELVPHSRAEEAVFYNSIRSVNLDKAKSLAWHGYEEHMAAEAMLRTLSGLEIIDAGWTALAKKLQAALLHHIQEEEKELFSAAQQLFTAEEAEAMADAFEKMKPHVRDGSLIKSSLDLIANMLPGRLAAPLRTFSFDSSSRHY